MAGKSPKRTIATGRYTLLSLALVLVLSGLLRLASGPALAVAESEELPPMPADHPPSGCVAGPDLTKALEAVQSKEARLRAEELAIKDRLQALAVAEDALRRNTQALIEAENSLRETMALAATAADDDLNRLTAVYENMKPKEAALLFDQMEPEFAAGFVARMRPDVAASIMAGLAPEKAYSISVLVAGRNALVPTE